MIFGNILKRESRSTRPTLRWSGLIDLTPTAWLIAVQIASTARNPRSGRTIFCVRDRVMAGSSRQRVHGEALRVLLGIGGIERDAVEERLLLHVFARCLDAQLLRDLAEDVRPVNAVDEPLVIGRLLHHPPAPELREPPHAVRLQREVRLAIEEGHVVPVLLLAAVTVVVVAEEAAEDDLLRAVDVLRLRDHLRHAR